MAINRRRAPSSQISWEKKMEGHLREGDYAELIGGKTISGTQKGDVKDKAGNLHSVKSGKKWQVFLYSSKRISECLYLNILQPCLDSFIKDSDKYFEDRIKCIAFKEEFIKKNGKEKEKQLSSEIITNYLGPNSYTESKEKLAIATKLVSKSLENKNFLNNFLGEALFNNNEVKYLAIKDVTYNKDGLFKVFSKEDVLNILTEQLYPSLSVAGRVPEDYNVPGQKILLRYKVSDTKEKNIVEIEIRNDSGKHYRQVRFNMYSKDVLLLLLTRNKTLAIKKFERGVVLYGKATETFGTTFFKDLLG